MSGRRKNEYGKLWCKQALVALFFCLALSVGCGKQAASAPVPVVTVEAPIGTPRPSPRPAPSVAAEAADMTFEEDGDIWFSADYAGKFAARTFLFDHAPRVLIYHTHAREAFRAPDGSPSPEQTPGAATPAPTATPASRSTDPAENVVHLGDLLSEALTARGFVVFHDRTDVEDPALATAYERSRAVMARYDGIDLYIDLHRNAADPVKGRDDVVLLGGVRTARLFFVVGTGLTADSDENELKNWQQNYILALSLTERLWNVDGRLCKDIRVKQKAYNQDMGLSLLAEIGHNANLMSDAAATVPYLADALGAVIQFPGGERDA